MGLKKGQTNNPRGRPKGKPNKATTDMRTWINELLNDNRDLFIKDLGSIEPYQRVAVFEKLFGYVVPKMQAVTAQVDLNSLSDAQLDMLIMEITKNWGDGKAN